MLHGVKLQYSENADRQRVKFRDNPSPWKGNLSYSDFRVIYLWEDFFWDNYERMGTVLQNNVERCNILF
jgi:hypothetical protein